jgi:hypothetical protein
MLRLCAAYASCFKTFICNPVVTKEMWDGVQDVHPKTLSLCVVVTFSSKKPNISTHYDDMLASATRRR